MEDKKLPEQVTPRIVEAVAVSANQGGQKTDLAKQVELAMADAVTKAYAENISNPDEIRKRMHEARDAVVQEHNRTQ